ncbi:MAG: DNA gyrase subunit A [Candidatus Lambdaproteobacteria bacterium]|nr:DNA gyrase subunit A [Candidatus Lambdaproteobacteria bacterium]
MEPVDPHVMPVNIEDEMRDSYMEYAMSVIIGRALPDVRDGLKPVHRRILFSMNEQGNHWNRAYRKSARIVGDVIGKYHPHGDTAIYDALVRLAQDFSMRHTLVDGQGNFGSVDGDSPAAMRYTEARMTRLAHEMLADLDKDTVAFQPNYDESLAEPMVLPARFPNLLVNGSTGIAVGMASNVPPHNLRETLEAFLHYIDHAETTTPSELMALLPGPDFPTGGYILGRGGILEAYSGGRGVITLRARCEIETGEKDDRETIVVHELPYMVNKARLLEKIAELVRDKRLDGVSDLRDESDRKGMRMVIEVKRGFAGEVVLNNLYKLTQLQTSFGIIMLAVVDGQPKVLSLPQFFRYFLNHRIEVIERRTRFELAKAEARAHILAGLRIALAHLDAVIEKIKAAAAPADARAMLIADYGLSEVQAQEILEMRLQRLTGLEQQKIQDEFAELTRTIADLQAILADRERVLAIIRTESRELKERYGEPRRTEIVEDAQDINLEDLITREEMLVTITHAGYIKRGPTRQFRTQRRGGKGKLGMTTREEDFVEQMFVASTHDFLLIFTSAGKVYWKKVYEIPLVARTGRGKAVVNLLPLEPGETVRAYLAVPKFVADRYVMMGTAHGILKKTELLEYGNPRSTGVRAINIDEGDALISVALTDGKQELFLATRNGLSLRFPEDQVRTIGRVGRGVIGIRLNAGDQVVGMEVLSGAGNILTVTERGFGKKTHIADYRVGSRGNKGIFTIKTTARNGKVVGIAQLGDDEEVMLITQLGKLIRMSLERMRTIGRVTQGVRLIDLDAAEKVAAVAKIVEETGEEGETEGPLN